MEEVSKHYPIMNVFQKKDNKAKKQKKKEAKLRKKEEAKKKKEEAPADLSLTETSQPPSALLKIKLQDGKTCEKILTIEVSQDRISEEF
jgi:hypothetical protein